MTYKYSKSMKQEEQKKKKPYEKPSVWVVPVRMERGYVLSAFGSGTLVGSDSPDMFDFLGEDETSGIPTFSRDRDWANNNWNI